MAATYSSSDEDLYFLLRLLDDQGYIENQAMHGSADISPQGLMELDRIKSESTGAVQGFVAMWFIKDLRQVYTDGFQPAILNAGYDAVRVDQIEHVGRIDDEIIAQIKASRFLVADFAGHRGGVYFEAGYALGMGLPVFWTCKKEDLDELHFDIRQYNCIDWESIADLETRLSIRIEAVLGPGPRRSL